MGTDHDAADEPDRPALPAPIEQAVELLVYAPLGYVLEARHQFPDCVARGRREIGHLQAWVGRRARAAVHESTAAFRGLGLVPGGGESAPTAAEATEPPTLSVVPDRPDDEPTAEGGTTPDEPARPAAPEIDADHLAIPGYESLSASQVVPRLVSLTADELELIRRYESAARGRKTILSRIAQLQAG